MPHVRMLDYFCHSLHTRAMDTRERSTHVTCPCQMRRGFHRDVVLLLDSHTYTSAAERSSTPATLQLLIRCSATPHGHTSAAERSRGPAQSRAWLRQTRSLTPAPSPRSWCVQHCEQTSPSRLDACLSTRTCRRWCGSSHLRLSHAQAAGRTGTCLASRTLGHT